MQHFFYNFLSNNKQKDKIFFIVNKKNETIEKL